VALYATDGCSEVCSDAVPDERDKGGERQDDCAAQEVDAGGAGIEHKAANRRTGLDGKLYNGDIQELARLWFCRSPLRRETPDLVLIF
jgi:hypothetical protein